MAAHQISKVKRLVPLLLSWFATNARDLAWRRIRNPYAIWVSEIMLQQTQVKTVIPYWERWMRELPTINSAAKASPAKLHKLWEGLGYYTRVRNLQKAAQLIVNQHDGKFPDNFDDILALPGIGRYTAGAIASIAFDQPKPILDGNVIRILTRIFGISGDPREKKTNTQLWRLAEELVAQPAEMNRAAQNKARPTLLPFRGERGGVSASDQSKYQVSCSHLNQSLMELGALICTPRNPKCEVCPVRQLCVACRRGWQKKLPSRGKRAESTARHFIAFVVERNGKFLVHHRPAGVVNAHLWEFPNIEVKADDSRSRHSMRTASVTSKTDAQRTEEPYQLTAFCIASPKPLCIVKHSITRYRITLEAWRAKLADPSIKISGRWLSPAQLHKFAFTSAHKRILTHLRGLR